MNNNLNEKVNGLYEQVKEKGLEIAITEYLQVILTDMGTETFPNGAILQQAVQSIMKTAQTYCDTREMADELSDDDIRQMIKDQIKDMDQEQAIQYLAKLHILYRYINVPKNENTEELMKQEYRRLITCSDEYSLEQKIEDLLSELDLQSSISFISSLDVDDLTSASLDMTFDKMQAEYVNIETAAIQGATLYGEAVQGNLEGVAKEVDAGILTAQTSAYYDTSVTAIQLEQNKISEEEAKMQLGRIGKALSVSLSKALYLAHGLFWVGMIAGASLFMFWIDVNAYMVVPVLTILFGLSINDMLTYDGELVQKNIQRTMLRLKNFFNKRKRVGQKRKSKLNA